MRLSYSKKLLWILTIGFLQSASFACQYCTSTSEVCTQYDWVCTSHSQECISYQEYCEYYEDVCDSYDENGDCISYHEECASYGEYCAAYEEVCSSTDYRCVAYETQCTSYYYGDWVTVVGRVNSSPIRKPIVGADVSMTTSSGDSSTTTDGNGLYALQQFVYADSAGMLNMRVCSGLGGMDAQCQHVSVPDTCSSPTLTQDFALNITSIPEPAGLAVSSPSHTQLEVSWNSGGIRTTGFLLAYVQGNVPTSCDSEETSVSLQDTRYSIGNLLPNTTYSVTVCAHDIYGNQSSPAVATFTTNPPPPTNPVRLTLVSTSRTEITASWGEAGQSPTSYIVAYRPGIGVPPNCEGGINVGLNLSAVLRGLNPGTMYGIRVCARNDYGTSDGNIGRVKTLSNPDSPSTPWRNPNIRQDVNGDGVVTTLDALLVINALNRGRTGPLPSTRGATDPYYDVSGDNQLAPLDALGVINYLNSQQ